MPAKPAATPVPPLRNTGPDRSSLINKPPVYAGPLRGMRSDAGASKPAASAASQIPGQSAKAPQGEKIDSSETSRNLENAAAALGVGAGAAGLYKLGSKLFKGGNKAVSSVRDLVTSPKAKSFMGKADDDKAASAYDKLKKSSFVKKKGDDVTDVTPKSKPMKSLNKPSSKKALDESDTTGGAIGYKRGGKMKKYASGGMVSSASKRADGIATKGKTRCKIC